MSIYIENVFDQSNNKAELTRQQKYIRPITLEQMLLRGVA